jgi:hypothetical protein
MKTPTMLILISLLALGAMGCTSREAGEERAGQAGSSAAAGEEVAIASVTTADPDSLQHLATCRAAAGKLGEALKSALQDALAAGGPLGALDVCRVEAEPIARKISVEEGLLVGRTSHRVRSLRNSPDAWEVAGLAEFVARVTRGARPVDLEHWGVLVDTEGHRTFRYLKAIPTAPLCLRCHGADLEPEVAAKLAEFYPGDLATGFAVGDMRGAFTVTLPLD